jgi:hypothetical protein
MRMFENRSKKEVDQYYLWFQQNMDSLLEKAKLFLGKKELDFTTDEVDTFGVKTRELLDSVMTDEEEYEHVNIFIAYYGMAWMHYFGGKWYFSNSKKEMSYGYPQIIEYNSPGWVAISPYDYYISIKNNNIKPLSRIISREIEFNNIENNNKR